jgi:hypothetical protein
VKKIITIIISGMLLAASHAEARSGSSGGYSSRSYSTKSYYPKSGYSQSYYGKATYVKGYYNKNGKWVKGHYRTAPNRTIRDNWSTKPNINPYTGKPGTIDPNKLR